MPRPPSPPGIRRTPDHLSEDQLEAFAMGKSLEENTEQVHSHLLKCDYCRQMLTEEVQFTQAIREALRELEK